MKFAKKENLQQEGGKEENECAWPELGLGEAEHGYRMPRGATEIAEILNASTSVSGKFRPQSLLAEWLASS